MWGHIKRPSSAWLLRAEGLTGRNHLPLQVHSYATPPGRPTLCLPHVRHFTSNKSSPECFTEIRSISSGISQEGTLGHVLCPCHRRRICPHCGRILQQTQERRGRRQRSRHYRKLPRRAPGHSTDALGDTNQKRAVGHRLLLNKYTAACGILY